MRTRGVALIALALLWLALVSGFGLAQVATGPTAATGAHEHAPMNELDQWMQQVNTYVHPAIRIGRSLHFPDEIGVLSFADIKAGELLVEVPASQWLDVRQARRWESLAGTLTAAEVALQTNAEPPRAPWEPERWLADSDALAFYILVQQLRAFSPLAPWLRMVPLANQMHATPFWSELELAELQNSPLRGATISPDRLLTDRGLLTPPCTSLQMPRINTAS